MVQFRAAICLVGAIFWSCGCSGPEKKGLAPAAEVKGTIKLDGKPVPSGELHFVMASVPPRVLKITDGNFSGEASVGKNKVEFYQYVDGPADPKYPDTPKKINKAPSKYWGLKTVLEATINAGGPNELQFNLSSK